MKENSEKYYKIYTTISFLIIIDLLTGVILRSLAGESGASGGIISLFIATVLSFFLSGDSLYTSLGMIMSFFHISFFIFLPLAIYKKIKIKRLKKQKNSHVKLEYNIKQKSIERKNGK